MAIKKEKTKLIAEHYNIDLVSFLGYDIIKTVYDASTLAIEDAQKFSNEVRTKALQSVAVSGAIIVGLMAAICTVGSIFAKIVMSALIIALTITSYRIFKDIIYRKKNSTRGNTQSYMLNQQMIDKLGQLKNSKRISFFLASQLKTKESEAKRLNNETNRMQQCFEKEINGMAKRVAIILIAATILYIFP